MAITRLNNNSVVSVSSLPNLASLPSGIDTGKIVKHSRLKHTTTISTTVGGSWVDSGIDHNYTALSSSNNLLHIINASFHQIDNGGNAGLVAIRANDTTVADDAGEGIGGFHQDNAWNDRGGCTLTWHDTSTASTTQVKYSIYISGSNFQLRNTVIPLIWTILEIAN